VNVTAEVCPHHLTITDRWVLGRQGAEQAPAGLSAYDTATKVYPPLRGHQDLAAVADGLAEGVIDCIATDHAPHELVSKLVTYNDAAFGISVLETALGSSMELVHLGRLTLNTLVERLTVGPARVLGPGFAHLATLQPGTAADIVVFDPGQEWVVDPRSFESLGKNTPLVGARLKGKVITTLVEGKVVYSDS
jgi:dihydroorotase